MSPPTMVTVFCLKYKGSDESDLRNMYHITVVLKTHITYRYIGMLTYKCHCYCWVITKVIFISWGGHNKSLLSKTVKKILNCFCFSTFLFSFFKTSIRHICYRLKKKNPFIQLFTSSFLIVYHTSCTLISVYYMTEIKHVKYEQHPNFHKFECIWFS